MKIDHVEVGMKVKLISTFHTDDELGYCEDYMLSVGECGEVMTVDDEDHSVYLSDAYWYSVKDLEPASEARQISDNTNIGNLAVSISLEDKQEIAKDILKIVLNDFNKVISDAITQLDDDGENEAIEIKEANNVLSQFTDQKMTEIVEQALKEAFKETFLNTLNK